MVDVICSGLNVVDLLVEIPETIATGGKTECKKIVIQGGAPAGNAACALATLGHSTAFLGYFGDNTLSNIAKTELEKHGVSSTLFKQKEHATPAIAIVQIDTKGERTVLYSMNNYTPFDPKDIDETTISKAKLILVDGYDIAINTYLLELAKKHQILSVLDLENSDEESMKKMISLTTNAILPLNAAQILTNKQSAQDCLFELKKITTAQLIITDGENGAFALENNTIIHQPAFKVKVVDTTGCGDSYHASYASALLQGMNLIERMEYASYYASQIAQHFGGRTHLPNRQFMNKNRPVFHKA